MSNLRLAEKLLAKAEQDLVVVSKWKSDHDIAEEIIGFHSKWLLVPEYSERRNC